MNKKSLECHLLKAKNIHGDKYDYSNIIIWNGVNSKYNIICQKHGLFQQRWNSHVNMKYNCPKCSGRGFTLNERIIKAQQIHNSKYDYSLIKE